MGALLPLLIQAFLPVAVTEVKKKLAEDDPTQYASHKDVPTAIAAPIAAKAAAVGIVKSKTSWFAVVLMILGFLEQNQELLGQIIPTQYMGLAISGIGFLTLLCRTITTQGIVDKGTPKED